MKKVRTKRIICCIIVAVIIAVSAIVLSANNDKNTLSFGVFNTYTGSGYEVTVTASSDYLCAGMQGVVEFDTSKLIYTGASDNNAVNITDGKIKVSALSSDVQNGIKGSLFELTFLSKEVVFADSFTFSKVKGVAVANNSIFASEDTSSFTYADCNKDKKINILDIIKMKKMAVDETQADLSADLDKDGIINSPDLVIMTKILLGSHKTDVVNRILNVSDFGAAGDGVTDDSKALTNAVKALSYSESNTVLNFGTDKSYFVSSRATGKTTAISLLNVENKTINGNNSTIVLDKNMTYMDMRGCENVTVKGLNFDLKERSHFVGKVVEKGSTVQNYYMDVETTRDIGVPDEYTPKGLFFGFATETDNNGDAATSRKYLLISKIKKVPNADNIYRIYLNTSANATPGGTYTNWSNLSINDDVILPIPGSAHTDSNMFKIFVNSNLTFEDLNVWNSRDFVWVLRENDGTLLFKNVNVMPPEDESVCFSSWRDAFHCRDNSAAITWENCTLKGNGDDIFNLSASQLYVNEVKAPNEVVCVVVETGATVSPAVGSQLVIWDVDTGKLVARTTLKEIVNAKTNHYILNDNIAGLTSGENIRLSFESYCDPNSKIINCDLDGTMRFHGGPLTVKNSTIRLWKLWIGYEFDIEGPLPRDINFDNCAFTPLFGNQTILVNSNNPNSTWKAGDYRLENISFTNCTGLTANHFEKRSENFNVNSPDYITFSPAN